MGTQRDNIKAAAKTPEQWVSEAAAGKNNARFYLRYLYSDGSRLVASDGHRLHVIPTELPAGFYDTALNPVDVAAKYPDLQQVIPPEEMSLEVTIDNLPVDTVGKIKMVFLAGLCWVNLKYLKSATNNSPSVTITNITDARSGIRIAGPFPGSFALIMPIRK